MDRITCMQVFTVVVKEKGFSAAARKLGISKVQVSNYIAQLETELGVRLLNRTTRQVSLTTTGFAYLEPCNNLLEGFNSLHHSVKELHQTPLGLLKITAPSTFAEIHLTPVLSIFKEKYPEVQIDLQLNDRYVDLIDEGYDLAIRIGKPQDSSLIAKPIGTIHSYLCASTDYLKQHSEIKTLSDLNNHQLIADTNYRSGKVWQFRHKEDGQCQSVEVNAGLNINSAQAVRALVLNGQGISLCPDFAVKSHIESGAIKHLLPEWQAPTMEMSAIYPSRQHVSAKVRLFIDEFSSYYQAQTKL
ncbi:LysR substrate-binding domain-containing protein [Neptuniibacter sp. PT8_73]|uniref:LysR family transcriptional regulator n=1 Tax=Neptuniibacter sp. PT8_73 TaxID=3398206 RepID=UPI0039F621B4